jgi:hypothetical protein
MKIFLSCLPVSLDCLAGKRYYVLTVAMGRPEKEGRRMKSDLGSRLNRMSDSEQRESLVVAPVQPADIVAANRRALGLTPKKADYAYRVGPRQWKVKTWSERQQIWVESVPTYQSRGDARHAIITARESR